MLIEIEIDLKAGVTWNIEEPKKVFPIRLPEKTYKEFRKICNKNETSTAVIIGQMIEQFNAQYKKGN
jgi:hypothetical protein